MADVPGPRYGGQVPERIDAGGPNDHVGLGVVVAAAGQVEDLLKHRMSPDTW